MKMINEEDDDDIKKEQEVMRLELDSLLKYEAPKTCKFLNEYIEHILRYLTNKNSNGNAGFFGNSLTAEQELNKNKQERINLIANHGLEGIKCSLLLR